MLITNTIDPIALTLGPVSLRWYGLLFALGFLIGYAIMQAMFRREGQRGEDLDRLLFYIFVGTLLGARLAHCLIYEPDFYLAHPLEILKIWQGGLASHGGTLGVIAAILIFIRGTRYTFLQLTDLLSVPVALVATLIRVGNYCNSEILGHPTDGSFGVIFARLGEDFPRHPVQIYEALAYLATFTILATLYIRWKGRPRGALFGLMLSLIFTARILIEPFKLEQADYSTGLPLTVGQLLSVPFALLGIILTIMQVLRARRAKSKQEG
ncbi:MAG: prolipoprotein diacylglyceryl transferase [Succinivibrionaceae bacterium]|nr:prolipoprotein diacylglyceryl transferase [Succinivibrionaceae bacterium]